MYKIKGKITLPILKQQFKKVGLKGLSKINKEDALEIYSLLNKKVVELKKQAKNELEMKGYSKLKKIDLLNKMLTNYKSNLLPSMINKLKKERLELINKKIKEINEKNKEINKALIEGKKNIKDIKKMERERLKREETILKEKIKKANEDLKLLLSNEIKNFISDKDSRSIEMVKFLDKKYFQKNLSNIMTIICKNISSSLHNYNFIFNINGKNGIYITLNTQSILNILKRIDLYIVKNLARMEGDDVSDAALSFDIKDIYSIRLIKYSIKKKVRENGGFFNMYNNTLIKLEDFGIYREDNYNHYQYCCFVDSLIKLNCDKKIIDKIILMVKNNNIPKKDIKKICESNNIEIRVKSPSNTNKCIYKPINNQNIPVFELGLINNHYFPIQKTNITRFALVNYHELMFEFNNDIDKINSIYRMYQKGTKKLYKRCTNRFLDSYDVINFMFINKDCYLKPMENTFKVLSQYQKDNIDQYITDLTYNEIDVRPTFNIFKEIKKNKHDDIESTFYEDKLNKISKFNIIHADFETLPNYSTQNMQQEPDMIYKLESDHLGNMIEEQLYCDGNFIINFLNSLSGNSIIIFHNSSYDSTFLQRYLFADDVILKGSRLIEGQYLYKNFITNKTIKIIIKDSYALIPSALKNFGSMFDLKINKAAISHNYYNHLHKENKLLTIKYHNIKEVFEYLEDGKKEDFILNLNNWDKELQIEGKNLINPENNEEYDAYLYRKIYCKLDVYVQKQGFDKFSEYINIICGINILTVPTLASLADKYLIREGCYDEVYELAGIPREFIQKCVVGGRTMSANNKKYKILSTKDNSILFNDFDAVSLYPSAMSRLDGFLKGVPKIINDKNYDSIKNYSGYFVEIKIKKVGIFRQFPLMSYIDNNGVRVWTNDMVDKVIYVDKTSLEDLINFQKVEFDIIKGYYFDEGFNNKIVDTIKYLFNQRVEAKKKKNPIQEIYKLLMNSSYGKSLLKPIENDYVVKNKKDAMKYIYNNFNSIISYNKIAKTKKILISVNKNVMEHFNRAHCGCQILSMSKRIMNEVMCLAEDSNLNIFYQDTDSMHIFDHQIEILSENFKKNITEN